MARKLHIPHSEFPYHVTARSHGGHWFQTSISEVWNVMSDYLYFISITYEVKIQAFVLMSNHFHLVVTTPEANLSEAMGYFMRETSKELNRLARTKNQTYGARFHRTLIRQPHHFHHVYKYVYRNPVTAGILSKCEDYKYSTLHGLLGQSQLQVPLTQDEVLFCPGELERTLKWLNTAPSLTNYQTLKKALSRKELKFPKNESLALAQKHSLEMHPY